MPSAYRSEKQVIYYSKTDVQSVFCLIPLKITQFKWVIMKAVDPETGKTYFFIDKCLPFGASISCALFQQFSDTLHFVFKYSIGNLDITINYLDDFLLITLCRMQCNQNMAKFLALCEKIGCPLAKEKTVFATIMMVFLGMLMDGVSHCICIPIEKKQKALNQIRSILSKRKATVQDIQKLTGYLNFLNRAIVPGRAFTQRMYAKLSMKSTKTGNPIKMHHHISLDAEFKSDASMWERFLEKL